MNTRQFEEYVCEHFRKQGYKADLTSFSGDCGVDVFATKGKEKLAIQAKMYGSSTRKINSRCIWLAAQPSRTRNFRKAGSP